MSKSEQEWAEEVEELKKKVAAWEYRAAFWLSMTAFLAENDTTSESVDLDVPDRLRRWLTAFVAQGIALGGFRAKVEAPALDEGEDETTLPWPIVLDILAEAGLNGEAILEGFIGETTVALHNATELVSDRPFGGMKPMFADQPITTEMAEQIIRGEFSDDFMQMFADKYILHVQHADRPCQHPYDSIEEAIEAAAFDLRQQKIVSVGAITRNGEEVMSAVYVQQRVDRINAAGLN